VKKLHPEVGFQLADLFADQLRRSPQRLGRGAERSKLYRPDEHLHRR
jgi:hypothetical protein